MYYSGSPTKENNNNNYKRYRKKEPNVMVQKSVNQALQETTYRNIRAQTDSNRYRGNQNPDCREDYLDIYVLDEFNLKENRMTH